MEEVGIKEWNIEQHLDNAHKLLSEVGENISRDGGAVLESLTLCGFRSLMLIL